MNWRSTTLRFASLVFLLQCVAAAALLTCVHWVVRSQVYTSAIQTAEILRQDLLSVYARGGDAALRQAVAQRSAGDPATADAVLLLADRRGRIVAGNLSAWPPGVALSDRSHAELYRVGHATPEAMLLHVSNLPGGSRLLTGSVVDDETHTIRLLELATPVALALAIAFAALAAWLAARMIVLRLDGTIATLAAVRAGDLSRRVPASRADDAFAMLADAINAMLDRIEHLMGELTLATDMLAHDLKSPLTRLHSALERAVRNIDTPVAIEAVDRAMAEGTRVLRMVETALSITRAEAGIGRDLFVATDLAAELRDIADIYEPLVEEAGRTIHVIGATALTLPLHRELIAQSLANLVDNALKYGAGAITLSVEARGAYACLSVTDEGSGIAPEHRATALRRFGRIEEARSGTGAGLGLSLVAAVARLHGGDVSLESAGGLKVMLSLPLTAMVDPSTDSAASAVTP
ncbi:sensor histidine kinase [Sphingomonas sp. HHU CXW]|uniref:histidine kinase n=1 Tax=Sphingomonas hominis TaxID=2741495 RepID=A0ABX2JPF4_9SPHN|nr:ATP-binding protein [Sphingomonas hominis]NTS66344.1 sensor histidine kinase [Sphingomonas hominis]